MEAVDELAFSILGNDPDACREVVLQSHLIGPLVKWGNYHSIVLNFLLDNDLFRKCHFQFNKEDGADLIRACIRNTHYDLLDHILDNVGGLVIQRAYLIKNIEIAVATSLSQDVARTIPSLVRLIRDQRLQLDFAAIKANMIMHGKTGQYADARIKEFKQIL